MTIPKLSAPLVKDIRTGEGICEYVLAGASAILTACGDVNIKWGIGTVTLLALVKGLRRGLIKLVGVQRTVGIGAPLEPHILQAGTELLPSAESVLAQIAAAEQAAATIQHQPGTPPAGVTTGLAADTAPAVEPAT